MRLEYIDGYSDSKNGQPCSFRAYRYPEGDDESRKHYLAGFDAGLLELRRKMDCQNETPSQPDELVAASVLDRAKAIVTGGRQTTHGKPERSFEHIAARWSLTLSIPVTPFQVALMMADLKQVRALEGVTQGAGEDHLVDMAGYVALAAELGR